MDRCTKTGCNSVEVQGLLEKDWRGSGDEGEGKMNGGQQEEGADADLFRQVEEGSKGSEGEEDSSSESGGGEEGSSTSEEEGSSDSGSEADEKKEPAEVCHDCGCDINQHGEREEGYHEGSWDGVDEGPYERVEMNALLADLKHETMIHGERKEEGRPGIVITYEDGKKMVRWVKLVGDKFSCLFCGDEGDLDLPLPEAVTR